MAGSRRNRSSGSASRSKTKTFHYHVFLDPPGVSGVNLEKRIDVAAYWMVRASLKVRRPLSMRYVDNSIRVELCKNQEWYDMEELPYMSIGFFDEKIELVSTDGSIADDGEEEATVQKVEYADPDFPEKVLQMTRDWFDRIKNIGRFKEAAGDSWKVVYARG